MTRTRHEPHTPHAASQSTCAAERLGLGLALSFALTLCGCVSIPGGLGGSSSKACLPHFAYDQGWLGGDAVYSIPIPGGEDEHETIWIFGDTYVGAPHAADRAGATLIHDSVGVSRCTKDGTFEIDYAWRTDAQGAAQSIFRPERERHYLWPFDGFFLDEELYVLLLELRTDSPRGPFGLPVRITRSFLARVANPDDPPAYWQIEMRALTEDGAPLLTPGVWVEGGFVHMMATPNASTGAHPRFLTRLPLDSVAAWPDDLAAALETFTNRGAWEPGLSAPNARMLMKDNATEMSLDRAGPTGRYFAVYSAPLQSAGDGTPSPTPALDGNSIFVRTAPALTGPWSERRRLYVIGEGLEAGSASEGIHTICYAGKAHAELSPPEVLALSYVCNLAPGPEGDVWGVLEAMKTRMDVYRPRVATAPWPELPAFAPDSSGGDAVR